MSLERRFTTQILNTTKPESFLGKIAYLFKRRIYLKKLQFKTWLEGQDNRARAKTKKDRWGDYFKTKKGGYVPEAHREKNVQLGFKTIEAKRKAALDIAFQKSHERKEEKKRKARLAAEAARKREAEELERELREAKTKQRIERLREEEKAGNLVAKKTDLEQLEEKVRRAPSKREKWRLMMFGPGVVEIHTRISDAMQKKHGKSCKIVARPGGTIVISYGFDWLMLKHKYGDKVAAGYFETRFDRLVNAAREEEKKCLPLPSYVSTSYQPYREHDDGYLQNRGTRLYSK